MEVSDRGTKSPTGMRSPVRTLPPNRSRIYPTSITFSVAKSDLSDFAWRGGSTPRASEAAGWGDYLRGDVAVIVGAGPMSAIHQALMEAAAKREGEL